MKPFRLPWFFVVKAVSPRPRALLGGLLLCAVPFAAGQSVTFAGAQSTIASGVDAVQQIAVDSAGDLFLSEYHEGIVELPRTAGGYGPPAVVQNGGLNGIVGLAVDGAGDLFAVEFLNKSVVELPLTAAGYGAPTNLTSDSGNPYFVAADSAGDVFILSLDYEPVVELPLTAMGYGPPMSLFTSTALGIAVDKAGDLFLSGNYVAELPRTTTGFGQPNYLQTSGLINTPGIAVDSAGDVFVADSYYSRVVELPKTTTGYGPQTTLPISGLNQPYGAAVDGAGNLFIADSGNDRVVEFQTHSVNFDSVNVCASGQTTPAPCSETLALNFNINDAVTLGTPKVLTGGVPNLDFTLAAGNTCTGTLAAESSCVVNVTFAPKFAGSRPGAVQIVDENGNVLATTLIYGTGVAPQIGFSPAAQVTVPFSGLQSPNGVAVDGAGDVFVSDDLLSEVQEVPAGGASVAHTFSGLPGVLGVAVDGAGDIFVGDGDGSTVVELPAGGTAMTLPFAAVGGSFSPYGLAVDLTGDVFVSNFVHNEVLELPAGGAQITLPVNGLQAPHAVATVGVAVDPSGNVFVAQEDSTDGQVLELPAGASAWTPLPISGSFFGPSGVAVDAVGNVLTVDDDHGLVWELQPGTGAQTTFPFSGLTAPTAVAADGAGDLFVVGNNNPAEVIELQRSQPRVLRFAATNAGGASSPRSVRIQNTGNATLTGSGVLSDTTDFTVVAGPGIVPDCTPATLSLAPGAECNLSIEFTPQSAGPLSATITLTDNALNGAPATQVISLGGTGVATAARAMISTSLLQFGSLAFGSTYTLPLTITNIGTATLTILPSINGQSYTIASSSCAAGVTAGNSCTLQVEFTPMKAGPHNDILTLATNGPANPTVSLQGIALGVSVGTELLQFGTIPLGSNEVLTAIITNAAASGTVAIGAIVTGRPNYKILTTAQNTCQAGVAAGHSCTLPVEFDPTSIGAHDDFLNLTISADGPATAFVRLDGIASAP